MESLYILGEIVIGGYLVKQNLSIYCQQNHLKLPQLPSPQYWLNLKFGRFIFLEKACIRGGRGREDYIRQDFYAIK